MRWDGVRAWQLHHSKQLLLVLFRHQSFLMRKHFFNHPESGYFKKERKNAANPLSAMGGKWHTAFVTCVIIKNWLAKNLTNQKAALACIQEVKVLKLISDSQMCSYQTYIFSSLSHRPQHGVWHDEGNVHQHASHDCDRGLDQLDLLRVHYQWVTMATQSPVWLYILFFHIHVPTSNLYLHSPPPSLSLPPGTSKAAFTRSI